MCSEANTRVQVIFTFKALYNWNVGSIRWVMRRKDPRLIF